MILIFDTHSGLCNQFYDIACGLNFCLINNIQFTFRYASFRNPDLCSWTNVRFTELFNDDFFKKYPLYIEYDVFNKLHKLNENNTHNLENKRAIEIFGFDNILNQLKHTDKEFIILKQFWAIHRFKNIVIDIYKDIKPSKKIIDKYEEIKTQLFPNDEKYNMLHYRYESDFINHFKIQHMHSLDFLIDNINYKNKSIKTYIASTNIKNMLNNNNNNSNIIFKNEEHLQHFNFEENAFIDYLFGINCEEIYGHSYSSFSNLLNNFKKTHNCYDRISYKKN